jgi:outer membrane protein
MKQKLFILAFLMFGMLSMTNAQRLAIVDVNALLQEMDDYKVAQGELDKVASKWRQEISIEMDKVKSMYNKYQAEQVLLSDEVRAQREEEIVNTEKKVMDMQKLRFGPEGDLFKRRQELVKPVQNKVMAAIEAYADDRGYDLIIDKGGSAGILFLNEDYDKTDDIRKRLRN